MACELKPAKTFAEQLAILNERGMIIEDTDEATRWLQEANYYRLTGYAFQFQKGNDKYRKPASFNLITDLYTFDKRLRSILLIALEAIEVYARATIAYQFSHAHGKNGGAHYLSENFANEKYHQDYLEKLQSQIDKNRRSAFVNHHIGKYGGKMPFWCAVEIMPLSLLSKLYSNMLTKDKVLIAASMGLDVRYIDNWLQCFSVLRNTCAHFGRLYNVRLSPPVSLGVDYHIKCNTQGKEGRKG